MQAQTRSARTCRTITRITNGDRTAAFTVALMATIRIMLRTSSTYPNTTRNRGPSHPTRTISSTASFTITAARSDTATLTYRPTRILSTAEAERPRNARLEPARASGSAERSCVRRISRRIWTSARVCASTRRATSARASATGTFQSIPIECSIMSL